MALDLSAQAGVDNSTPATYPNGVMVDNTTVVSVGIHGDSIQLWSKILRLAGITPNGLPDNEVNGFQLLTALKKVIHPGTKDSILISNLGTATIGAITFAKYNINGGIVAIQSKFQISTGSATTLQVQFPGVSLNSGNVNQNVDFVIDGTRELGKVLSLNPLVVEFVTGAISDATYNIEIFGTLLQD